MKKHYNVGKNHPMFGKHHTEETKKKMRKTKIGKVLSEETKRKIGKANKGKLAKDKNWNYIDGRTSKKHYCEVCKKEIGYTTWYYGTQKCRSCAQKQKIKTNPKKYLKISMQNLPKNIKGKNNGNYGKHRKLSNQEKLFIKKKMNSIEVKIKMQKPRPSIMGKKNPNYIHGNGYLPYPLIWGKLKEQIRQRDHHKCRVCNKKGLPVTT